MPKKYRIRPSIVLPETHSVSQYSPEIESEHTSSNKLPFPANNRKKNQNGDITAVVKSYRSSDGRTTPNPKNNVNLSTNQAKVNFNVLRFEIMIKILNIYFDYYKHPSFCALLINRIAIAGEYGSQPDTFSPKKKRQYHHPTF